MTNNLEAIEPIPFVQDHFPNLLLSTDVHDLGGAVASAEYLSQDRPNSRVSYNLVSSTRNALINQEALDIYLSKEHPLTEVSGRAGRALIRGLKIVAPPVYRYHAAVSRAVGLFTLTEYKVETGQPLDTEQMIEEYERLMDITSGLSQSTIKHIWLERYYRNLLSADKPLSQVELSAVRAGLKVCKNHTMSPVSRPDLLIDTWRLNRRAKQVAA